MYVFVYVCVDLLIKMMCVDSVVARLLVRSLVCYLHSLYHT